MDVQAAVYMSGVDRLSIERLQLQEPGPDELLVRIVACGICHTDQKVRDTGRVPTPIVLGHEGAGIVERVGCRVVELVPGDHVVLTFDSCGQCRMCREHHTAYCVHGEQRCFSGRQPDGSTTLRCDGAPVHGSFFGQSSFATYALCSPRNAVRVTREAPLELLGPLGCGIQTGAGAVLNSFALRPGQTIAVLGVGAVGLSAVMAARVAGASRIIAVDRTANRLALAMDLGATDCIDAGQGNMLATLRGLLAPDRTGVDFVLDTTGVLQVMHDGLAMLGPRGTFGFVSNTTSGDPLPLALGSIMGGGRTIRGIVQGDSEPHRFIPMLLDLFMQGRFPFDRLISFYPFERINDAFADSHRGVVIKPVVRIAC